MANTKELEEFAEENDVIILTRDGRFVSPGDMGGSEIVGLLEIQKAFWLRVVLISPPSKPQGPSNA